MNLWIRIKSISVSPNLFWCDYVNLFKIKQIQFAAGENFGNFFAYSIAGKKFGNEITSEDKLCHIFQLCLWNFFYFPNVQFEFFELL